MVDIPRQCMVCNANLSTIGAVSPIETCGVVCERVLKYGEQPDVARVRALIATGREEPCGTNCPGWAVFNSDTDPVLSRCDECWFDIAEPLTDDDLDVLPEAQHELRLAIEDGGGYEHPDLHEPCTCGCTVFRLSVAKTYKTCSACGSVIELPDPQQAISERTIAALDLQDAMDLATALRDRAKELRRNATVYESHKADVLGLAARERAKRFEDIAEKIDCDPVTIVRGAL